MRRDVGALDVADLALEALVDDLVLLALGELGRVLVLVPVDEVEQRREAGAQVPAQPAPVTQVVDPGELVTQVGLVEVLRVPGVVRHRHGGLLDVWAGTTTPPDPRRGPGASEGS